MRVPFGEVWMKGEFLSLFGLEVLTLVSRQPWAPVSSHWWTTPQASKVHLTINIFPPPHSSNHTEVFAAPLTSFDLSLRGPRVCLFVNPTLLQRMGESTPMILQGPVGGPETVASGLLADLLRVCTSLGARDHGHRHLMKSASSFTLSGAPSISWSLYDQVFEMVGAGVVFFLRDAPPVST